MIIYNILQKNLTPQDDCLKRFKSLKSSTFTKTWISPRIPKKGDNSKKKKIAKHRQESLKKNGFIICLIHYCTMDSVIDGKPARNNRGSLTAQQWVDVNVDLPYGIIGTVCVMIQNRDL